MNWLVNWLIDWLMIDWILTWLCRAYPLRRHIPAWHCAASTMALRDGSIISLGVRPAPWAACRRARDSPAPLARAPNPASMRVSGWCTETGCVAKSNPTHWADRSPIVHRSNRGWTGGVATTATGATTTPGRTTAAAWEAMTRVCSAAAAASAAGEVTSAMAAAVEAKALDEDGEIRLAPVGDDGQAVGESDLKVERSLPLSLKLYVLSHHININRLDHSTHIKHVH